MTVTYFITPALYGRSSTEKRDKNTQRLAPPLTKRTQHNSHLFVGAAMGGYCTLLREGHFTVCPSLMRGQYNSWLSKRSWTGTVNRVKPRAYDLGFSICLSHLAVTIRTCYSTSTRSVWPCRGGPNGPALAEVWHSTILSINVR